VLAYGGCTAELVPGHKLRAGPVPVWVGRPISLQQPVKATLNKSDECIPVEMGN